MKPTILIYAAVPKKPSWPSEHNGRDTFHEEYNTDGFKIVSLYAVSANRTIPTHSSREDFLRDSFS